jgi:hypothetical protein
MQSGLGGLTVLDSCACSPVGRDDGPGGSGPVTDRRRRGSLRARAKAADVGPAKPPAPRNRPQESLPPLQVPKPLSLYVDGVPAGALGLISIADS